MARHDDQRFVSVLREANVIAWLETCGQRPGEVLDSLLLNELYTRCQIYFASMARSMAQKAASNHSQTLFPLADQERVDTRILEGIKSRIPFKLDHLDFMAVQMRHQFISWSANPSLSSPVFALDVDDDGCVWLRSLVQVVERSAAPSAWEPAKVKRFCQSM